MPQVRCIAKFQTTFQSQDPCKNGKKKFELPKTVHVAYTCVHCVYIYKQIFGKQEHYYTFNTYKRMRHGTENDITFL